MRWYSPSRTMTMSTKLYSAKCLFRFFCVAAIASSIGLIFYMWGSYDWVLYAVRNRISLPLFGETVHDGILVSETFKGYKFVEQKTDNFHLLLVIRDPEHAEDWENVPRGTCHVIDVEDRWASLLHDKSTLQMIMKEIYAAVDPDPNKHPKVTEEELLDYYRNNDDFKVCGSGRTVRRLSYTPDVLT